MKRVLTIMIVALSVMTISVSCEDFLKEKPKTFLSPDNYFTTEGQMHAAVNGLYNKMGSLFTGGIGIATDRFLFPEFLTGYAVRPRPGTDYFSEALSLQFKEETSLYEDMWKDYYNAIENCNSTISGLESSTVSVSEETKNQMLGESYCLRAYYYFQLTRYWGEVPLKTTVTTDLANVQLPLASQEDIYAQIVSDLTKAETLMENLAWARTDGHIGKGAVKSLLAKVYITMAGYPLHKGTEYYQKAYDKANEVVASNAFSLFGSYADFRNYANANTGEFILSIQRNATYAVSPLHNDMLPYPEPAKAISANPSYGGGMAPTLEFYNSYDNADLRKAERGYFYTKYPALDGSGDQVFARPFIYKYWDGTCASTGNSGMNFPIVRYADVLLTVAEAKTMIDGGTTKDAAAINDYYLVRKRAMPGDSKPTSLSFDTVFKERAWEFAFEHQTWFDMIRTRKAYNPSSNKVVDLIGYQSAAQSSAFEEGDLLLPYPIREVRLNPNLHR
jgi:hypothetical protein